MYRALRFLVVLTLVSLIPVVPLLGQTFPATIVSGPGVGTLLTVNQADFMVNQDGGQTMGRIVANEGGAPPTSFTINGMMFTTDEHYHGTLLNATDPNGGSFGWGYVLPDDLRAFLVGGGGPGGSAPGSPNLGGSVFDQIFLSGNRPGGSAGDPFSGPPGSGPAVQGPFAILTVDGLITALNFGGFSPTFTDVEDEQADEDVVPRSADGLAVFAALLDPSTTAETFDDRVTQLQGDLEAQDSNDAAQASLAQQYQQNLAQAQAQSQGQGIAQSVSLQFGSQAIAAEDRQQVLSHYRTEARDVEGTSYHGVILTPDERLALPVLQTIRVSELLLNLSLLNALKVADPEATAGGYLGLSPAAATKATLGLGHDVANGVPGAEEKAKDFLTLPGVPAAEAEANREAVLPGLIQAAGPVMEAFETYQAAIAAHQQATADLAASNTTTMAGDINPEGSATAQANFASTRTAQNQAQQAYLQAISNQGLLTVPVEVDGKTIPFFEALTTLPAGSDALDNAFGQAIAGFEAFGQGETIRIAGLHTSEGLVGEFGSPVYGPLRQDAINNPGLQANLPGAVNGISGVAFTYSGVQSAEKIKSDALGVLFTAGQVGAALVAIGGAPFSGGATIVAYATVYGGVLAVAEVGLMGATTYQSYVQSSAANAAVAAGGSTSAAAAQQFQDKLNNDLFGLAIAAPLAVFDVADIAGAIKAGGKLIPGGGAATDLVADAPKPGSVLPSGSGDDLTATVHQPPPPDVLRPPRPGGPQPAPPTPPGPGSAPASGTANLPSFTPPPAGAVDGSAEAGTALLPPPQSGTPVGAADASASSVTLPPGSLVPGGDAPGTGLIPDAPPGLPKGDAPPGAVQVTDLPEGHLPAPGTVLVTPSGQVLVIGNTLGAGRFQNVNVVTVGGQDYAIKVGIVGNGPTGVKGNASATAAADKASNAVVIGNLLSDNGIPQINIVGALPNEAGVSYVITDLFPEGAVTFHADNLRAGTEVFGSEFQVAVLDTYEALATKGIVAADAHVENFVFVQETPGGPFVAKVSDHDQIAPFASEEGAAIADAYLYGPKAVPSLVTVRTVDRAPTNAAEALVTTLESKGFIKFEGGKFVPGHVDPALITADRYPNLYAALNKRGLAPTPSPATAAGLRPPAGATPPAGTPGAPLNGFVESQDAAHAPVPQRMAGR